MVQSQDSRPRVLVIDNEYPIRDLITQILADEDIDVATCESGEEALQYY